MILPPPNWPTGPSDPQLPAGEVHVWRIPLGNGAQLEACRATLSEEEAYRAERFVFEKDTERFVTAHGGLRLLLASYLGRDAREIDFAEGPYGKPRLDCAFSDLRFNLSHSGDVILIAIARNREVGVDVEQMNEKIQFEQIADLCFTPREAWELRTAPAKERVERFFDLWTRLEARLKAEGAGIGGPLPDERWHARNLAPAHGYAAAVASEGEDWQLACWEWSL